MPLSDTLWHLEAVKTRAALLASQRKYWFRWAVGLWFFWMCVALVVGLRAPEQRKNAVVWLWASIVQEVKPDAGVVWRGKSYDAYILEPYLTRVFYGDTLWHWLSWSAGCGVLAVTLIGRGGYWYIRNKQGHIEHIRGAELVSVKELQKRVGAGTFTVAGVKISEELRRQHIMLEGATGTGKTTEMRKLLRQIADRKEPCVVVDIKGHLTSEFYDPARGDVLLNPVDLRGARWDFQAECATTTDLHALGASVFPTWPGMQEAAAFYRDTAQGIFRKVMTDSGVSDIEKIPALLEKAAKGEPKVIPTLRNGTAVFSYLAESTGSRWSAREWVANPGQSWCFLVLKESDKEALLPILKLWIELLTRRFLTRPLPATQTLSLVIDELSAFERLSMLEDLLSRGREFGISVILGFQTIAQLYQRYGDKETRSILGSLTTHLLLRANDPDTQEWCARDIGKHEVRRKIESETVGPEDLRDSIHRNEQRSVDEVMLASEFRQLKDLHGVLNFPHGCARVYIPYVERVVRQPAFVPLAAGRKDQPEEGERIVSRERRAV